MSPQVGDDFGEFRIDGILGRGGMGMVYRAWQHRMRRPVALKVLSPEYAMDPAYRERFSREAAALARLDSPHVVTIFDHGSVDGYLYLAMQLINGADLSRLLSSGPLSPVRALAVVDQSGAQVQRHDLAPSGRPPRVRTSGRRIGSRTGCSLYSADSCRRS
jgi:serine/threonine protein kinase